MAALIVCVACLPCYGMPHRTFYTVRSTLPGSWKSAAWQCRYVDRVAMDLQRSRNHHGWPSEAAVAGLVSAVHTGMCCCQFYDLQPARMGTPYSSGHTCGCDIGLFMNAPVVSKPSRHCVVDYGWSGCCCLGGYLSHHSVTDAVCASLNASSKCFPSLHHGWSWCVRRYYQLRYQPKG